MQRVVQNQTGTATLPLLEEPRAGRLTIGYSPTDLNDEIVENPPRFTWLPVIEDEAFYTLRIQTDTTESDPAIWTFTKVPLNFFTPDVILPSGQYIWSYAVCDSVTGDPLTTWSTPRQFRISDDLPETPLECREERFSGVSRAHPRLWMTPERLNTFRDEINNDKTRYNWSVFFENSALPWMDKDIMAEPAGYPNHQRVAPIWRQTYINCQELLYAVRHLSVGGKVTQDDAMLARAKEWLLAAASWDPNGTTSRGYTDEWAFRVNLALAWGYDWLHDELTEDERELVRKALLERTRETANHIINNAKIQLFPYDSHAVRAVSAVLIPASIALLDDSPEAETWLNYSIEFLFTIYSPWGDKQGGWAEGPHYWMTGMAYLIDAANLLKSYAGIDLYQRPFFQHTGDFPFYTKAPATRRGTFGDDSTMGDLPCLKVAYNLRQFAGVTGNAHYQWYFEEILRNDPGTAMEFYNFGWWDLNFDDMVYRHDFPVIKSVPPTDIDTLRWFKGIGWAAIQHGLKSPDQHIGFIMKSSSYGSISHSHGDQNAFVMSAYGEDLAIQSGYYVAFNSSMHKDWRRQTRSKNAILINGAGQYANKDKALAMSATGNIEQAIQHSDHVYIKGDATAAYATLTPTVEQVIREVYFVHNSYFVIVDSIDASEPVSINWLLHTNDPMNLGTSSFKYSGERAGFYGQFVWSESGQPDCEQITGFPDVDAEDYAGLPVSSHLNASFPAAKRQRIATLLVPYSLSQPKRIFHFIDDQGYDLDIYFSDSDENSFAVNIKKLART